MNPNDCICANVITSGSPTRGEWGIKEIAISLGKVNGQKYGKLNVFFYGGSVHAQAAVESKIRYFFTQTLHGSTLLKTLESCRKFIDVIITSNSFKFYDLNTDVVLVFRKPPEIKQEDLSKGDLKKYKTTTTDGSVTTVRTTTQGEGGEASLKGASHWAGKKTELEKSVTTFYGLVVLTGSSKIGYAETEVNAGTKGLGLNLSAAARGPNASVGGKIHINLFGGFDLITVNVNATTGSQLGANAGYSPDKGFGFGAKAALGGGAGVSIGILNLYNKSMSSASETIEAKKTIGGKK